MTGFLSRDRAWAAIVLTAAGLILFAGLGRAPLFDRDEGEYATVARSMLERADWVVPHVNERPYYEKPALYFWLTALCFKLFGYNEAAARLPSALAGLALVLLMAWFGRRRCGPRFGRLAAILPLS
ncbi:MAG: glycosyltransferase family 39 protein, partial [Thermodesulfobacteriota bacterium]